MKRFTSEEVVLTLGTNAEDKNPDPPIPPTGMSCPSCCPATKPLTPKCKKSDARASKRDLEALQRQLDGSLGG